jgi:hypothetical protein
MSFYKVEVVQRRWYTVEVEADSESEAESSARKPERLGERRTRKHRGGRGDHPACGPRTNVLRAGAAEEAAEAATPLGYSGGGEIRTLEELAPLTVFETAPFDRSGTPPWIAQVSRPFAVTIDDRV